MFCGVLVPYVVSGSLSKGRDWAQVWVESDECKERLREQPKRRPLNAAMDLMVVVQTGEKTVIVGKAPGVMKERRSDGAALAKVLKTRSQMA